MRNIILLTCLLLLYSTGFISAQNIITGKHGINDYFHDFVPDTSVYVLDPNGGDWNNYPSDSKEYSIDLNGDKINDVKLSAIYINNGKWYQRFYSMITPLGNNRIAIAYYDSCYNYLTPSVFKYRTPIAKSFFYDDKIDEDEIWIDSSACLAYHDNDANYVNCYKNNFKTNDVYLGVKILIPNDTLYSWIKITAVKYDSMVVKEFASNKFSTGINDINKKYFIGIIPNPSNGKFILRNDKIEYDKLSIYNLLGEEIYKKDIKSKSTEIDLSDKQKGFYIVNVFIGNKMLTDKIILQ